MIRALEKGRVHLTEHLKQRAAERSFTAVDAERIIRTGSIVGEPEYCPEFNNWRFGLRGKCEGRTLEVRVAVDFNLDLEFPVMLVTVLTGFPKGKTYSGEKL